MSTPALPADVATWSPFMRRAIELAMQGRGSVEPNPMVGCVLVKNGWIIGEGFHGKVGGPHAEPTALADCAARGEDPCGATAVVTLEPCCHTNKRTPPCVPALIEAGVTRVVLGAIDPNPDVNGKGITQLRTAGIEVVSNVLEAECNQLLAPFIALTRHHRPYVTVKWAVSAEGFIAGLHGQRRQITGDAANHLVHRLRARCGAILVGGETVRKDNPLLTVRGVAGARALLRVVVTSDVKSLQSTHLIEGVTDESTVVFSTIEQAMADLAHRGIAHVLVESGGRLAQSLVEKGLADRLWQFRSAARLNEAGAIPALIRAEDHAVSAQTKVGDDMLTESFPTSSPVYFAAESSADLLQLPARE